MNKIFFILLSLVVFPSYGQESLSMSEYELSATKGVVYFEEFSVELEMQTSGLSLGFNKGIIRKYYLTQYYHFDIGYIMDSKERKNTDYIQGFDILRNYSFGKQNYFFIVRGGLGKKYFLSEKARKRGIATGFSYEVGANLGILKPYYLVLEYTDELNRQFISEAYSEDNAHLFLDVDKIINKGSFFEGWDELGFVPGIHANIAAHFSLGAYERYVRALEVGLNVEAYIKKIPIMVETPNNSNSAFFAQLFFNIQLGKRWR